MVRKKDVKTLGLFSRRNQKFGLHVKEATEAVLENQYRFPRKIARPSEIITFLRRILELLSPHITPSSSELLEILFYSVRDHPPLLQFSSLLRFDLYFCVKFSPED